MKIELPPTILYQSQLGPGARPYRCPYRALRPLRGPLFRRYIRGQRDEGHRRIHFDQRQSLFRALMRALARPDVAT